MNEVQITKTGSNENWKAKNIYDISSNVSEYTMEYNNKRSSINSRVLRGGPLAEYGYYLLMTLNATERGENSDGGMGEIEEKGFRICMYM